MEDKIKKFSILSLFRSEIEVQTASLRQELEKISAIEEPASENQLESLMQIFRSIRGAAEIIQLRAIMVFCRVIEDALEAARENKWNLSRQNSAVLQETLNMFLQMLHVPDAELMNFVNTPHFESLGIKMLSLVSSLDKPIFSSEKELEASLKKERATNEDSVKKTIIKQMISIQKGLSTHFENPKNKTELPYLIDMLNTLENSLVELHLHVEKIILLLRLVKQTIQIEQVDERIWPKDDIEDLLKAVDFLKSALIVPDSNWKNWLAENQRGVEELSKKISLILNQAITKREMRLEINPLIESAKQDSGRFQIELDEGMIELFRVELENQTSMLTNGLLALEEDSKNKTALEGLMRSAHSIKGAARVIQQDSIVRLTHSMEDCFVALQRDKIAINPELIDVMLQAVDFLLRLCKIEGTQWFAWLKQENSFVDTLVNAMQGLLASENQGTVPETPQLSKTTVPPSQKEEQVVERIEIEKEYAQASSPKIESSETSTKTSIEKTDGSIGSTKTTVQKYVKDKDRVLRVTTQNLNRLMGLAGESLVESRWLQPFADELFKLKQMQEALSNTATLLRESLEKRRFVEKVENYLTALQEKINECRQNLNDRYSELEMFIRRHVSLSDRLYGEVIDSRMRPFSDGVENLPRLVRDISRQRGKKIKLEIIGKTTQVDREILEKLESPLIHLLQNAIDYGIETATEREAVGKPAEGLIRLEAQHLAGMLYITVSDDGRGINIERLRQTIIDRKLIQPEAAAQLKEQDLLDFLLLPGFSMAASDAMTAGKGVGLHVVNNLLQQVSGSLKINSVAGEGTNFYLQLPLTRSVIRSLLVDISGEPYAFPLARIDQILMIPESSLSVVENRIFFNLDNENIGLVHAQQLLKLPPSQSILKDFLPVIVIREQSSSYGVVVDKLSGEKDLVVQELDPRLGKIKNISTGAFMEDGSPILVINVDDLIRSLDELIFEGTVVKYRQIAEKLQTEFANKRILVVDDSLTVREVESRLLKMKGYNVDVAVNGVEGWKTIQSNKYDLVITDVDMPLMNGIELLKLIKNDNRFKDIPVVILSYKENQENRLAGLDAGADYYLTKSAFQGEQLFNVVDDLIGSPLVNLTK